MTDPNNEFVVVDLSQLGLQQPGDSQQNSPFQYKTIRVLLFRWQESDLKVEDEQNRLGKIFEEDYGFKVSPIPIPSRPLEPRQTPAMFVDEKLQEFRKRRHSKTISK